MPDPEVLALIERGDRAAGIRRRPITDEEIIERTIYALINEGARVLEEGVALRAADIDVVYSTATASRPGAAVRCSTPTASDWRRSTSASSAFHRELGQRWAPAPLLARLAREGSTFQRVRQEPRAELAAHHGVR